MFFLMVFLSSLNKKAGSFSCLSFHYYSCFLSPWSALSPISRFFSWSLIRIRLVRCCFPSLSPLALRFLLSRNSVLPRTSWSSSSLRTVRFSVLVLAVSILCSLLRSRLYTSMLENSLLPVALRILHFPWTPLDLYSWTFFSRSFLSFLHPRQRLRFFLLVRGRLRLSINVSGYSVIKKQKNKVRHSLNKWA